MIPESLTGLAIGIRSEKQCTAHASNLYHVVIIPKKMVCGLFIRLLHYWLVNELCNNSLGHNFIGLGHDLGRFTP